MVTTNKKPILKINMSIQKKKINETKGDSKRGKW